MKHTCEEIATAVLGSPARRRGAELLWRCPNHDDKHPSLRVNTRKDCFLCGPCGASGSPWKLAAFLSRCDPGDKPAITSWMREHGLLDGSGSAAQNAGRRPAPKSADAAPRHSATSPIGLSPAAARSLALPGKKIVDVYRYTGGSGQELFIKVRYEPKDFRIARPDSGGAYVFGSEGTAPVLFRLPAVESADQVLLVEGEKDVLTAERLGFTATTKTHGASSSIDHSLDSLRGKAVVICYDNDDAGRAAVARDADRLRGVAASRKIITVPHGKDLTAWVEGGGTSEEVRRLIEQAPELKLPNRSEATAEVAARDRKEPATRKADENCPTIPEAAWYGLSRDYRDIVGPTTEASPSYHFAAFVTAVGAALGRTVYVTKAGRHYPNLFTVLVGPSGGGRKSTALNLGVELLQVINPEIGVIRSIDSREGFIEHLGEIGKGQKGSGWAVALVRLAELRSLIDKTRMEGLRNIVPALTDAYDCPPSLEVHTRKAPVSVSNPTVSLFAATTRRWIDGLSEEDLEGGLGNRIAFVPGEPGPALPNPQPRDLARWGGLVQNLKSRIDRWWHAGSTEFSMAAEAGALWDKIYPELYDHRTEDALIAILCERLQNHCLKVALIFAALDGQPVIERHHLEAAYAFTQFLYDGLWSLFRGFGASPMAQLDAKIIEAVRKAGPSGIRQRVLKKLFWRVDAETFNRRLYSLVGNDGPLETVKDGHRILIRLAETDADTPSYPPNT